MSDDDDERGDDLKIKARKDIFISFSDIGIAPILPSG